MREKKKSYKLQDLRNTYIRTLAESENSTEKAREIAESLYALDLTVYSRTFTFDSIFYSAFAQSILDENIIMHPEQLEIIRKIEDNDALIVSAPTSFGKTYCVFEYIAKHFPKRVVLVVPTLALIDEYLKKIIKKYHSTFSKYKIHTNVDETRSYENYPYNIFILTHDRVVYESTIATIGEIDFLVIDEIYKLETNPADRVLILNIAYYYLSQNSKKYVLLAPFIKEIKDIEILEKQPVFYSTEYSPVINDVKVIDINAPEDRYKETVNILDEIGTKDKTLIYFPTVTGIYKYVSSVISQEEIIEDLPDEIAFFIAWAKEEIHDDWCVVKALERGYLIHNGQIPIGTRLFQMDYYENSSTYNRMLCTSTLLEGVNTTAKNIIITKPSRFSDRETESANFSAFDFFNLVGRTGRLYKHYIGKAFYIKAPNDPPYEKIDAVKSIKFEITDDSKDIDIQKGNFENRPEVIAFLKELNITCEEYKLHIGSRLRFENVKIIFENYKSNKKTLLDTLYDYLINPQKGRLILIRELYKIIDLNNNQYKFKLETNAINKLLDKRRPTIKTIVNEIMPFYKNINIDNLINTVIKLKMSYIEHQFYTSVLLIRFFMEKSSVKEDIIQVLENKVISPIEQLYFTDSKHKKMLLDLGVYERDINKIIKIIGNDFNDANELSNMLAKYLSVLKQQDISFISKYVIQNLTIN